MRRDVLASEEFERDQEDLLAPSVQGFAMVATTGLVAAMLRGSSLVAMALSSVPLWKRMDPLMILSLSNDERRVLASALRAAEVAERSLDAVLEGEGEEHVDE